MSSFERVFVGLLAVVIGVITGYVGGTYPDWQVGGIVMISGLMTVITGLYTIFNSKTWAKSDW